MTLRDRLNPADQDDHGGSDNIENLESFTIVLTLISGDDSKDDTAEVTRGFSDARNDATGEVVYVRYESEVSTIPSLEEECHTSNESEHGRFVVAVGKANDHFESSTDDSKRMKPDLLVPNALGVLVDCNRYHAS